MVNFMPRISQYALISSIKQQNIETIFLPHDRLIRSAASNTFGRPTTKIPHSSHPPLLQAERRHLSPEKYDRLSASVGRGVEGGSCQIIPLKKHSNYL